MNKLEKLQVILRENLVCYNKLVADFRQKLIPNADLLTGFLEFDDTGIALLTTDKLDDIYANNGLEDAKDYVSEVLGILVKIFNVLVDKAQEECSAYVEEVAKISRRYERLEEL